MPPPGPPSEFQILNRYLLQPSSLPTILPYKAFLASFPHMSATMSPWPNPSGNSTRTYKHSEAMCSTASNRISGGSAMDGGDDGQMIVDLRREPSVELELSGRRKRKRMHDAEELDSSDEDDEEVEQGANRGTRRSTRPTSRGASSTTSTSIPQRSRRPETENGDDDDQNDEDEDNSDNNGSESEADSEQEIPESPSSSPPPEQSSPPPVLDAQKIDQLLDTAFHGPRGLALPSSYHEQAQPFHTKSSLLAAMQSAVSALETEITQFNEESDSLMASMKETVGGLSDLRYGKFANESLAAEVKEALKGLSGIAAQ
ncbi:uncharacterized protein AB675_10739 [Cyphellophora attinorum]|uniref:Uncharacterized protein n=1 Tax=Cyphellophora attinorum TaxID=1664694 RepID=A0A0N1H553_9EURO|nr:uncharacterized protein AB675_10739 [Phialophora attinorum]KPI40735.1 hypothetical protein AB675_10739 [Phialophora attinorum]